MALPNPPNHNLGLGLIDDVDVERDDIYTLHLQYWDPLEQKGFLLGAATKDATERTCSPKGYLDGIISKCTMFLQSTDIADRSELKHFLDTSILGGTSNGKVTIVWGPKSTGKTKLLESCYKKRVDDNVFVVYVNGRQQSLAQGIAEAIESYNGAQPETNRSETLKKVAESFSGVFSAASALLTLKAASLGVATGAAATLTGGAAHVISLVSAVSSLELCAGSTTSTNLSVLEGFLKFSESIGKHPSLVIDEANRIISGDLETHDLLSAFCSHTKEHSLLSLTLCTSSHSYPHKISSMEGLELQHATIRYAAELSPKEMMIFLTDTLGMGDHLARACLASCGGNVFCAADLAKFAADPNFKILRRLQLIEGAKNVRRLLHDEKTRDFIENLGTTGIVYINSKEDPIVKSLVDAQVAGIVEEMHVFDSQMTLKKFLQDFPYGMALVPSSEALRHYILFEMKQKDSPPDMKLLSPTRKKNAER